MSKSERNISHFKVVRVRSTDGARYQLHQGLLVEIDTYSPYIAKRRDISRALRFPSENPTVPYLISTNRMISLAEVRLMKDAAGKVVRIDIGCQTFTGQNFAKLFTWAVSF